MCQSPDLQHDLLFQCSASQAKTDSHEMERDYFLKRETTLFEALNK